jgi:hypothetical protein
MNGMIEQSRAIKSIPIRPFGLVGYCDGQSTVWLVLRPYAIMTAEIEIVFPIRALG